MPLSRANFLSTYTKILLRLSESAKLPELPCHPPLSTLLSNRQTLIFSRLRIHSYIFSLLFCICINRICNIVISQKFTRRIIYPIKMPVNIHISFNCRCICSAYQTWYNAWNYAGRQTKLYSYSSIYQAIYNGFWSRSRSKIFPCPKGSNLSFLKFNRQTHLSHIFFFYKRFRIFCIDRRSLSVNSILPTSNINNNNIEISTVLNFYK